MARRILPGALALIVCAMALMLLLAGRAAWTLAQDKASAGKEVFGLTKVIALYLEIAPAEYEAMQPPKGKGFAGGPGGPPPQPAPKPQPGGRPSEKNAFGLEFPWAQGDVTIDSKMLKKIGVRYAGDGNYFA